jgi:hypothetical protein
LGKGGERNALTRSGSILLAEGVRFSASGIRVGPDSTFWQSNGSDDAGGVPTSAINTITFRKRLKGGIKALVLGAGLGALFGYASGDSDGGFVGVPAEAKAAAGSAILGVVGLAAGLMAGHQDVYEFVERPRQAWPEEDDEGG